MDTCDDGRFTYLSIKDYAATVIDPEVLLDDGAVLLSKPAICEAYETIGRGGVSVG